MKTKIFKVTGKFKLGEEVHPFTKEMKAVEEEHIYEKLYAQFGSQHGLSKEQIKIEDISEITADEVTDPIIQGIL